MYSFAQRPDTRVLDEPMYAHYLVTQDITYHPGHEEIISALPVDLDIIYRELLHADIDRDVYFIKGMAHHFTDVSIDILKGQTPVFLIRDPYQLIASFAQVISAPTMQDIGLACEWQICQSLLQQGATPLVIDSNDILSDPRAHLSILCQSLDIPFFEEMLSWPRGPLPEDGVWAPYWYENVWKSTGFAKQKTSTRVLPSHLTALYEEALMYYDQLKQYKIGA